jgi:CDP-glucose 4,6-dehydratase
MEVMGLDLTFWKGKKVFLTGHTGFKGTWASLILCHLGAEVYGYALPPNTSPSFYNEISQSLDLRSSTLADIRNLDQLSQSLQVAQPDIIIHMAAQPLVRRSYDEPLETYSTNLMGLANLLDCARKLDSLKVFLNVTSDKCYENKETQDSYSEDDRLGGHDPYSNSKACAELITQSYRDSFFAKAGVGVATARAGNVIGGGDWSIDRLIPDYMRAKCSSSSLSIRNPNAIRPWQHVIEPLVAYLILCQSIYNDSSKYSEAWNFGPNAADIISVRELLAILQNHSENKVDIKYGQDLVKHEAILLKLNSTKAKEKLGWHLRWTAEDAIKKTLDWYNAFYQGEDIYNFSLGQLNSYVTS